MNKLKHFLGLVRLVADATDELGLTELTPSDKVVLLGLWEAQSGEFEPFHITFEKFVELNPDEHGGISRAQFYKSLKKFEMFYLIERIGSSRSSRYAFVS